MTAPTSAELAARARHWLDDRPLGPIDLVRGLADAIDAQAAEIAEQAEAIDDYRCALGEAQQFDREHNDEMARALAERSELLKEIDRLNVEREHIVDDRDEVAEAKAWAAWFAAERDFINEAHGRMFGVLVGTGEDQAFQLDALTAELAEARATIARVRDLANGDFWRVTPCGCGHRADLHTAGNSSRPVCTGGLGTCPCDWSFWRIAQHRLHAALDAAPTPAPTVPRRITTPEELDALPRDTVIRAERIVEGRRTPIGYYFERRGAEWTELEPSDRTDGEDTFTSEGVLFACRGAVIVLWTPEAQS